MDFIFDPGLVLYLPLWELHGASSISKDKHGHQCTVTGALWTPQGRLLDGVDDEMSCGTSVWEFKFGMGSFTIEGWAKSLGVSGGVGTAPALFGVKAQGTTSRYALQIEDDGDVYFVAIDDGGNEVRGSRSAGMNDNDWHHLMMIVNRASNLGYVLNDGEQVGTAFNLSLLTGDISPQGEAVSGAAVFGGSCNFNGYIGEVRLYNRALSVLEGQRNYLATKRRYR